MSENEIPDFSSVKTDVLFFPFVLSTAEKAQIVKIIEFIERKPEPEEWVERYTQIKTLVEWYRDRLIEGVEMREYDLAKCAKSLDLVARAELATKLGKVTEDSVSNFVQGHPRVLKIKTEISVIRRLAKFMASLSYNISKDIIVQDSVNARHIEEEGG